MVTCNYRRRTKRLQRAQVRAAGVQDWCRYYAVCKALARLSFGGTQ